MSGEWADLGNRLYQQGGRQDEAEQAYRQAIAAGDTEAWLSLGNLLYEQQGRQDEAEQAYRQAIAAGDTEAQSNLAILRSGQQGRPDEAEQPYRSGATAGEIQQWPLTAAATVLLLGLPSSSAAKGGPVRQPAHNKELVRLLSGLFEVQETVCLALKELIVRGAYRIQMGSGFWKHSKVELLPQQPPPLPWLLARLDAVLRPHTPGNIGAVINDACKARGGWAGEQLADELERLPLTELTQRGLADMRKKKSWGLFSYLACRRTASGDAWAQSAEQHVQRLQGLPQEAENDPQTAARAAAAAGALALLVPASLASLARLRGRSRRRGGDLDLDFAYVSDAVAFDPFDPVGDLYDAALAGGWPTKPDVTVGDLLGLGRGVEEVDPVTIALDSMRGFGLRRVTVGGDSSGGGPY